MVKKKNRDHLTVQQSNRWHCDFLGRIKTLCKSAGNSQSKDRGNAVLFQSEVGDIAEGFNLVLLGEITDEYNNPVRNISDLWSLLTKIEVTEKAKTIKSFYLEADSIESMVRMWDMLEARKISLTTKHTNCCNGYIIPDDIDMLIRNVGISLPLGLTINQKVQALLNNAFSKADLGFRTLYGDRIVKLKEQHSQGIKNIELFNEIRHDLKRYVDFI